MDKHNQVCADDDPYTVRLKKLTEGLTEVEGLSLIHILTIYGGKRSQPHHRNREGRAVRVLGNLGIKLDYSVTPVLKMAISR